MTKGSDVVLQIMGVFSRYSSVDVALVWPLRYSHFRQRK